MRGEIIILASLGTLAVFAGDYLRKAWHEITQDTPDDDPYLSSLCREIRSSRHSGGGGGVATEHDSPTERNDVRTRHENHSLTETVTEFRRCFILGQFPWK